MRLTRLLLAALLAALALVPASTAQDTPPEATTSAEVAPQSMILRSPLPIIRGPPNPTTAPGTYPDPTCPGSDDNNPPDFERLANEPYKEDDKAMMLRQTIEAVAAKRGELADALINETTMMNAWASYKALYGLDFGSSGVDARRRSIFAGNLRKWRGINDELAKQGDDTLAYGITRFAHMTNLEFKRGLLDPSLGKPETRPPGRRLQGGPGEGGKLTCGAYTDWSSLATPPPSFDWRAAGSITPVRNQGGCGSCSNMAATAAIENVWIRKWWSLGYRSWNTDLAEQDFLNCMPGNQCKGSWPDSVMDRYICKGGAFESALPYKAADADMYPCSTSLPRYNTGAKSFMYVPPGSSNLAKAVMKAPTVIGVDASNWQGLAAGWVRNCGEPNTGLNHGVAVVGWIDNVPMTNGQTWDYWFIKNSWGAGFCNNGYIWIRKDCSGGGPYGMYTQNHWVPNRS